MDINMPQAALPPSTPEELRSLRFTLPPNPEDATVFYKHSVTSARFIINGPPQWGDACTG